ncbi:uncharacterized protein KY384_007595 [Bacidia gigantensis]|uniref:uncharacterized protein n=1 Tax=Bacidia gigantensis TaxID=2732470 RepID=UPI001D03ED7C|nr:uncharacterized protein KY384_007595 [Bacidia gigantensis]KAG8527443.1 hypothetical protein KY384_007595 [Bacidia gigantensis]
MLKVLIVWNKASQEPNSRLRIDDIKLQLLGLILARNLPFKATEEVVQSSFLAVTCDVSSVRGFALELWTTAVLIPDLPCQNHDISHQRTGQDLTPEELAESFMRLQEYGVHNINLVTPEHVAPQVALAILYAKEMGLSIPIIYNTSAYDSEESLQLLDGLVDIYLADFKLWEPESSKRLLKAEDYPDTARKSIQIMQRQVGDLKFTCDGLAKQGVLLRHLVMPGKAEEGRQIMAWLAKHVSTDICLNVMEQYRPDAHVGKSRKISKTANNAGSETEPVSLSTSKAFAYARLLLLHMHEICSQSSDYFIDYFVRQTPLSFLRGFVSQAIESMVYHTGAAHAPIIDIRQGKQSTSLKDEIWSSMRSENRQEKVLPTLLLYDEQGLKLFEEITYLQEYYLTQAEIDALERWVVKIVEQLESDALILELDACELAGKPISYYALDVNEAELRRSLNAIEGRYDCVTCQGLLGSYEDGLKWLKHPDLKHKHKAILWMGSSIGNFSKANAASFVKDFSSVPRSKMLIAVDACLDKDRVLKAYNDTNGKTHEFILNGLKHANDLIGEQIFNLQDWSVIGEFDSLQKCHRASLTSSRDVFVAGKIGFRAGERICIEESHKYSYEDIVSLWESAGVISLSTYGNPADDYPRRQVSKCYDTVSTNCSLAMHLETYMYMLLQSDWIRPPTNSIPDFEAIATRTAMDELPNEWTKIPGTTLDVGLDDPENDEGPDRFFGWDNEKPRRKRHVAGFEAMGRPITNGDYATYLEQNDIKEFPASWSVSSKFQRSDGDEWDGKRPNGLPKTPSGLFVRTVYGRVPLQFARSWPVSASYDELRALLTPRSVPTAEEVRSIHHYAEINQDKASASILERKIAAVNG